MGYSCAAAFPVVTQSLPMEISVGDPAIVYTGTEVLLFCKIPEEKQEISNKRQAASEGNKSLIHRKGGIFDLSKVIGHSYGQKFYWDDCDRWSVLLQPTGELITKTVRHRTQILYRADISLALLLLDLQPGKRVVECGTGSGSLTYSLATTVAPTGTVYTFDYHNQRKEYAEEFFRQCRLTDVVKIYERNAYLPGAFFVEGEVDESSIDSVFLDIPSPWDALKNVKAVLKTFGKLVTFTPTIEQSQRTTAALSEEGFLEIKTFEILCKPWGIGVDDVESVEDFMNGLSCYQLSQLNHTGYITVSTLVKD